MRTSGVTNLIACALLAGWTAANAVAAAGAAHGKGRVDFNRDIKPLLSDNCYYCHGPDEQKRKAKIRLDTREGLFATRHDEPVVKPKDATASLLWQRVSSTDADEIMPPPKSGKKLKPEQVALLKRWIEEGAEWKGHWSFAPPARPAIPEIRNPKSKIKTPIDNFILARLQKDNLNLSPEADRPTLIRRVTLDLTGLPPTPAEVDAFLADKSPDAYERAVDRLIKSPRYGEHMARYWLDAARYGDTHGLHLDNERSMWPYRDWVVAAFNRNMPFDQFSLEQLAGDLLPKPTREQVIATGFNRCNVTTGEGGSIDEEVYVRYAVDRTETTAAVWMGLTVGCAVCHDHKFDPISQKEFYRLYAFFNNCTEKAMDGNVLLPPPVLKLASPEQQMQLDAYDSQIGALEKKIRAAVGKIQYSDPATLSNAPPPRVTETVWVDDDPPAGAKLQHNGGTPPPQWIEAASGKVFSGQRALKRTDTGLAQDFFSGVEQALTVGTEAKLYANVYLDPANPPKAIMLQFHSTGWLHRANWGDSAAIPYGKTNTTQKVLMGPLPATGRWVRLEVNASKIGLKPGTKLTGMAFTQFGGTVYWDKAGLVHTVNPAKDPRESQTAWEKQATDAQQFGKLPDDVRDILRAVPPPKRTEKQLRRVREYYLENIHVGARKTLGPLQREIAPLKTKHEELDKVIPATMVMKELDAPRPAHLLIRGQYDRKGEAVSPGVPAALPPLPSGATTNRLDFARWLFDPKHPLTARVTVNRFWQQFFGTGLVKTSNDFGSQGEPPSHPELLDWLAVEFRESGWDMKRLVRLLVTSATYRQDSKVTPPLLGVDPENRLLARGPRFRLDAEVIRDHALFVSGLLKETMGGKGVKPYQPENIWEPVAYSGSNTREYKQDKGDALFRRSLYTFWKRTAPPPAMTTFDAPSRESCCVRRERSNTPLQALALMNDVQQFEAARHFAQRLIREGGASPAERLAYGFRVVTARPPAAQEQAVLQQALDAQLDRYRRNTEAAKAAVEFGDSPTDPTFNPSELAAYTMVASLLLNLDEAVTRN
jgi:hypothetical protein